MFNENTFSLNRFIIELLTLCIRFQHVLCLEGRIKSSSKLGLNSLGNEEALQPLTPCLMCFVWLRLK